MGKRGRPPKHPVESQTEVHPEVGADPDAAAVESVVMEELDAAAKAKTDAPQPEAGTVQDQSPAEPAADGEHTCSECGMSFPRRYSLIMHTLKHEKARGYKCSVSVRPHGASGSPRGGVVLMLSVVVAV